MLAQRQGDWQEAGTRTQESLRPQILTSSSNKGLFVGFGCLPEGTFPSPGWDRSEGGVRNEIYAADMHFLLSGLPNPTARGDGRAALSLGLAGESRRERAGPTPAGPLPSESKA